MEKVIAIFDVGKTNKKLILFDQAYHVVSETEVQLPQISDDDGDPCEDVGLLAQWLKRSLTQVIQDGRWEVVAVNCSAYGASFVNLDDRGNVIGHLYNYLKSYPVHILEGFYHQHGPSIDLSVATASPPMSMLNSGLQLYWLKKQKPWMFDRIKTSLHLPQYCGFVFSGMPKSEITSIGCHTLLWDFAHQDYHNWAKQESITRLFPPIFNTSHAQAISFDDQGLECGVGIHDSSAALVPYLLGDDEPFALISTGTWSITLNPFDDTPIDKEALKKDCLNYLSYQGESVKASRLFLGNEYDHQQERLMRYFHKSLDYHRHVRFDQTLVQKLINSDLQERKFMPQTMEGTGPLPLALNQSADLDLFGSYEEAYHQLMLDLVALQVMSFDLAVGDSPIQKVFVAGGFAYNEVFMRLLATRLNDKILISSSISRAAALGAALVIHEAWNPNPINLDFLNQQIHRPPKGLDLSGYQLI